MTILEDFEINSTIQLIAIVGGGGKTSLMYALALAAARAEKTVVTTTTTKIYPPTIRDSQTLLLLKDDPELARLAELLHMHHSITVGHSILTNGKLQGVSEETIQILVEKADLVIVEADGAFGKPIKAPEAWEPVIPSKTNLVIPVIGLDCLGKPANNEWVFRLERFLSITGMHECQVIKPKTIAKMLTHPEGALKGVGPATKVVPFLNKIDLLAYRTAAIDEIATFVRKLSHKRIKKLVFGSMLPRPITRVIKL